jgi:hypothetical protein
MQLVAYGAQDVYLTGNPQITFWKVVYRRHTLFALEAIEQTFTGTAAFGKKVSLQVQRNSDLTSAMFLKVKLTGSAESSDDSEAKWAWVERLGHNIVDEASIQIGGTQVDKHSGVWLDVYYELFSEHFNDREGGYDCMIGNTAEMTTMSAGDKNATLFVPLQFWFNRNAGLALPLIALQYHDVRVNVTFADARDVVVHSRHTCVNVEIADAVLLIDYVYLDTAERKKFATTAHEYLIEQVQSTEESLSSDTGRKVRLNFNHPVKCLVWVVQPTAEHHRLAYHLDGDEARRRFIKGIALLAAHYNNKESVKMENNQWQANENNACGQLKRLIELAQKCTFFLCSSAARCDTEEEADAGLPSNMWANYEKALSFVEVVDASCLSEITDEDIHTSVDDLLCGYERGKGLEKEEKEVLDAGHVWVQVNSRRCISGNPTREAQLKLNGHDRFSTQPGVYFQCVQPHSHFNNTPRCGVNAYSFALTPCDHQPSGSCNFSRIDNATLNISFNSAMTGTLTIFAVNYNVLRIMSGMGGLAYSN